MKKLLLLLTLFSCDAVNEKLKESYDVTCYSADTIIYHGYSEGQVVLHETTWYFTEAKTGKRLRVSGNCLIVQE